MQLAVYVFLSQVSKSICVSKSVISQTALWQDAAFALNESGVTLFSRGSMTEREWPDTHGPDTNPLSQKGGEILLSGGLNQPL